MDAEAFVSVPLENNDSEMFPQALSELFQRSYPCTKISGG
jgi:hypothetical protein